MITAPDLDYDGGFAVYLYDRLIGRIYYLTLDNKSFFSTVPDGMSPEEFEKLDWWVDDTNDQISIIDNLTGTKIPNERYSLRSFYMLAHFTICPFIWYHKSPSPFKDKTIIDCIKTFFMIFPKFLMDLPHQIIQAMIYCYRLTHYTSWVKKQLYKKVESHLASQKTAVIDLRRGQYSVHRKGGPCQHVSFTESTLKTAPFVPLKKEFLEHIESFILALPSQNQSEFYLQLRSWIEPEKVVELVIFEPINLDDFLMYKNIKKLALPNADNLESLENLASFEQLEHIFISSSEDKSKLFDAADISDKITIDCIFGDFATKECFRRWQNGNWCDCSKAALPLKNEGGTISCFPQKNAESNDQTDEI
jgi:hypothetical protein